VLNGINQGDKSSESLSAAGDINGDGIGDIIIGAPKAVSDQFRSGECYVVFGRATRPLSHTDDVISEIEAAQP
jgi:hypothetical protein